MASRNRRQPSPDPGAKPPGLADLQAWFGRLIATPLPDRYAANPLETSAPDSAAEADARLRPKSGMGGFARLGVYNEQYWFRLVSVMQADYACTIHLMGLKTFNDWAVRYLTAYPPASLFLADLDKDFPAFLEAAYRGPNREAVLQGAAYERALSRAFDASAGTSLADAGLGPGALTTARLRLAPHVTALHLDWDFAEYRARCVQDESLEAEAGPPNPLSADVVIHRSTGLEVLRAQVSPAALALLLAFPGTLAEIFAKLEGALAPGDREELERGVEAWFRAWVAEGWLCLDRGPAG